MLYPDPAVRTASPMASRRGGVKNRDQVVAHWSEITKDIVANHILSAPNILGEVGWWYNSQILNVDVNAIRSE